MEFTSRDNVNYFFNNIIQLDTSGEPTSQFQWWSREALQLGYSRGRWRVESLEHDAGRLWVRKVEEIDYDRELYKWRRLVENFFGNLKRFRRTAIRFEKTDLSCAAMLQVVSSRLALA